MKIDVIIPVYKPDAGLLSLLDRLETQSVPVNKIILINTEEKYFRELTDGTGFAERYPNAEVHHIARKEFDHGGTRHQAVQYSDAEIFICMTQDALPADDRLVERLTGHFSGNGAVCYARQLPGADSPVFERASRYFNYPEVSREKTIADLGTLGIKTYFCSNVCAAYRRDVYEKTGGFIRHTIFNEDMIYAAAAVKAGYAIRYEAQAQVIHSHQYTNWQQLRRNFDLGVSQADHPEVFAGVSSESEGKRLVVQTWRYLKEQGQRRRFPGFCLQCGFKYAGYLLGRHYKKLPRTLVLKITDNQEYWD